MKYPKNPMNITKNPGHCHNLQQETGAPTLGRFGYSCFVMGVTSSHPVVMDDHFFGIETTMVMTGAHFCRKPLIYGGNTQENILRAKLIGPLGGCSEPVNEVNILYIHHITSHHITSYHMPLHYISLHIITYHYIILHYIALHDIRLYLYGGLGWWFGSLGNQSYVQNRFEKCVFLCVFCICFIFCLTNLNLI